jgi:hypothetical protein
MSTLHEFFGMHPRSAYTIDRIKIGSTAPTAGRCVLTVLMSFPLPLPERGRECREREAAVGAIGAGVFTHPDGPDLIIVC